jgi:hypothetical protein
MECNVTFLHKPVRIGLWQIINAIRRELAVQEENKLGNVNIFEQF